MVPIGGSKFKPPSGKPALGSAPAQPAVSKVAPVLYRFADQEQAYWNPVLIVM